MEWAIRIMALLAHPRWRCISGTPKQQEMEGMRLGRQKGYSFRGMLGVFLGCWGSENPGYTVGIFLDLPTQ